MKDMIDLCGCHLIDGEWQGHGTTFNAEFPATGDTGDIAYHVATSCDVFLAVEAAQRDFATFAGTSLAVRAGFLRAIANRIEAHADELTRIAHLETALPVARLTGERGRTTGQLRFFADWIEQGHWLDARIDTADPNRTPLPKPDIRSANRALGPVAVFGASNFPLAFSVAGGDTASALAAGCPVVVKAHPAHPGTSELVARAIHEAVAECALPTGVFAMLQGNDYDSGQMLVANPGIKAVGFTGSLRGGRALYDIAVSRPDPIPFFGELGSNNPVFVLPQALTSRGAQIAEGWAGSLTLGAGQFCTNPGVLILPEGPQAETLISVALDQLTVSEPQVMLTRRIADAYRESLDGLPEIKGLRALLTPADTGNCAVTPGLYRTDARTWLDTPALRDEIFGPAAIVVTCADADEMLDIARALHGQLTATLHTDPDDDTATDLMTVLQDRAGRVLVNGFPTGVEVCHAMVHGGPYPASTAAATTSVGSLAIARFVRPVSYQDSPQNLLPDVLKDNNPLGIPRLVDGAMTTTGQ
ncbi:aldehyde dehydrogenase (NADP(+)) [Seohaeicola saemankumensis]|nr:aldehyde dehydrogenase (NADP(+)) [Seohaeicola saemankumensis]MCA0872978.1 aldehyde dehydrogenase (NADP(+)) [Seohaeicola saemankumensis]